MEHDLDYYCKLADTDNLFRETLIQNIMDLEIYNLKSFDDVGLREKLRYSNVLSNMDSLSNKELVSYYGMELIESVETNYLKIIKIRKGHTDLINTFKQLDNDEKRILLQELTKELDNVYFKKNNAVWEGGS